MKSTHTHTQHHSTWKVALYKIFKLRSDSDLFYAQYCMGILPINYVVDPRKLSFLSKQRTHPLSTVDIISLIFVSNPQLYCIVRVVTSIVRTDHKAVVALSDRRHSRLPPKSSVQLSYRRRSPVQHAQFLRHVASMDLRNPCPTASSDPSINTQAEFDYFYSTALGLLDQFYPEHSIKVTSRDPAYLTPTTKSMLRRKNRLMRAGRLEEANALSTRIGKEITRRCKSQLSKIDGRADAKEIWKTVKQLTGRRRGTAVKGITAESLNSHYADISTDSSYTSPMRKQLASSMQSDYISDWNVFKILDNVRPTAAGLDGLPAWFLRLGAPVFCTYSAHKLRCCLISKWLHQQSRGNRNKLVRPRWPYDMRPSARAEKYMCVIVIR